MSFWNYYMQNWYPKLNICKELISKWDKLKMRSLSLVSWCFANWSELITLIILVELVLCASCGTLMQPTGISSRRDSMWRARYSFTSCRISLPLSYSISLQSLWMPIPQFSACWIRVRVGCTSRSNPKTMRRMFSILRHWWYPSLIC